MTRSILLSQLIFSFYLAIHCYIEYVSSQYTFLCFTPKLHILLSMHPYHYLLVPDNVGVSASGELVWNQTNATYTFKANWTVPRTYNLPEDITSFLFARLRPPSFFIVDRNFREDVPAVRHACKLLQSVPAWLCAYVLLQSPPGMHAVAADD